METLKEIMCMLFGHKPYRTKVEWSLGAKTKLGTPVVFCERCHEDLLPDCSCGLHWGHTGKHAPRVA